MPVKPFELIPTLSTARADESLQEPTERYVSCQRVGLIGARGDLYGVVGVGALLPESVVSALQDGVPVGEIKPIQVGAQLQRSSRLSVIMREYT